MTKKKWMALLPACISFQSGFAQSVDDRISVDLASNLKKTQSTYVEPDLLSHSTEGSFLLCGGGQLPPAVLQLFFSRGKAIEGNLVIIPTASPRSDSGDMARHIALWKDFSWKNVSVVHVNDSKEAHLETVTSPIRNATAVWIVGGDQQRLWDRFYNTPVIDELRSLVRRGGIVGGTSAGAAIASRIMIAGGITSPTLADGWGFFPNWIIDQHFSQRGRFERLAKSVDQFPHCLGIGIDESTGIVVDQRGAEVIGNGSVYMLDYNGRLHENEHFQGRVRTQRLQAGARLPAPLLADR